MRPLLWSFPGSVAEAGSSMPDEAQPEEPMKRFAVVLALGISLLITGCGGGGGGASTANNAPLSQTPGNSPADSNPAPAVVDVSGKWEFANGINVNISQVNSLVTGTDVYQTVFQNSGILLIEPCSPNSVTGSVSALTVMLQSGNCDVTPPGGYSTTTAANTSGTLLNGGAWGNAFKVGSLTGSYSGTLTFYSSTGASVGSTGATLTLTEDQNHSLTGTIAIGNEQINLGQMNGQAVGGTIKLGNGTVVGVINILGTMTVAVTNESPVFCGTSCSNVGSGVLQ